MNLDFTWESYGDAYRVFDGSGGVHVSGWYETFLIREVERLTRERDDEVERHAAFSRAVGDAVAPLGNRYLDPPDGGSVDLPEFIARAVADLLRVERERDEARKQRDNAESDAGKLQAEVNRLRDDLAAARAERDGLAHRERVLDSILTQLVALKDGPRDDTYYSERDGAWERARAALAALPTPPEEADRA